MLNTIIYKLSKTSKMMTVKNKLLQLYITVICCLCANVMAAQQQKDGYFPSFDGVKIHYTQQGKGFPVLLIHGFTGKGADWQSLALYHQLDSAGFSVITIDLRGGGRSDKPHTPEAYENDAEAKDIIGLMAHLKYKQYAAVGYSRGSIILARLLVLDKHLKAAVMGGMGADFTNPLWPRRIAFYKGLMNDTTPGFEAFYKRIKENQLDQLALAYQQNGQPSTSKEALAKVKQPVLVICGIEDKDNGDGKELTSLMPTAKFAETPGNHNSAWHTPEFSQLVLDFLQSGIVKGRRAAHP
jgi:pimeloyl-ACP methyl ester carboxylesterase